MNEAAPVFRAGAHPGLSKICLRKPSLLTRHTFLSIIVCTLAVCSAVGQSPRPRQRVPIPSPQAAASCLTYTGGHGIGNIIVPISDWGYVGLGPAVCDDWYASNITYPKGSRIDYGVLSVWLGGVRNADTLVSSGFTPWYEMTEMVPRG